MSAVVEVLAVGFAGELLPVRFPPYGRVLVGPWGHVSPACPLVVRWKGSRRRAERMVERLRRHGHQRVKVRKMAAARRQKASCS